MKIIINFYSSKNTHTKKKLSFLFLGPVCDLSGFGKPELNLLAENGVKLRAKKRLFPLERSARIDYSGLSESES